MHHQSATVYKALIKIIINGRFASRKTHATHFQM